jgi:ribosomal protein S18 acetylase RimI-like enzyme
MGSTEAAVLRAATPDDADAILDLCVLSDIAEIGEANTTIDEVRSGLRTTTERTAVLEDPRTGLLGYAWVEHQPGQLKSWGDLMLRPGLDRAAAETLLEWLRMTASDLAPGKPVHTFADSHNTLKQRLYESAGGTVIRRFYRMGIDLTAEPPAEPVLADGVEIRPVHDEAGLREMHAVVDTAFLDHFGHEPESFESFREHTVEGGYQDLGLWWLATVDGDPAAGLFGCRISDEAAYVATLGTLRAYRGRGLGKALLATAFAEYRRRGYRKAVLGVDAASPTGALALYESAGMTAEHEGWRYELPPQRQPEVG